MRRCALAMFTIVLACARAASADPVETSFAFTLNPLDGEHAVTNGGVDRINFAPLPLAELVVRDRNESIRIEGLPPVSLRYGGAQGGGATTSLSIVNATYRHAFAGGWFVGAGQTIYNQSTSYGNSAGNFVYRRGYVYLPIYGHEVQYSRVTGPRVEIGRIMRVKHATLEMWVAANPRMHGVQYTRIPAAGYYNCFTYGSGSGTVIECPRPGSLSSTFADPENAAQFDVTARIAHRVSKHGEIIYGFRYLNYTAHYDDFPGELADRNVGFAPVIGYRARF